MASSDSLRVLVYGGRGFVGDELVPSMEQDGWHVVLSQLRVNIFTTQAVAAELDFVKPHRVLILIGKTRGEGYKTIDYLEDKPFLNVESNLFAPLWLAMNCAQRKTHCTFFSTGCIYESHSTHTPPYTEEDPPNFFGSSYSMVKAFTDQLMRHPLLRKHVLAVRIRMPILFSHHPFDFVRKITSYARVIDVSNSMSVLPTLFPALLDMMRNKTAGTINLVNPGAMSHNEVLTMYRDLLHPEFTWANFTVEEQDQVLKSRRSNNRLSTKRLQAMYPGIPTLRSALREALLQRAVVDEELKKCIAKYNAQRGIGVEEEEEEDQEGTEDGR